MGGQFMIKISDEKWAKLPQIDDRLTEKYGPVGSPQRKEFQAKAEAYQKDPTMMPVYWYETCVKEETDITSFLQAPELSEFADDMMKAFNGISILKLQQACMEKFGERYCTMKIGDWYHVVKDYVERQTHRSDVGDNEEVTWIMAADTGGLAPTMVTD